MQLFTDLRYDRRATSLLTVWRAVGTWANLVTVLRTAVSVPLGLASVLAPSRPRLLLGPRLRAGGPATAPVAGPRRLPRAVHGGRQRPVAVLPALAGAQPQL